MSQEQREQADKLFEAALEESGGRDPRDFYRKALRSLKEANPEGYPGAVDYFNEVLVNTGQDWSDPEDVDEDIEEALGFSVSGNNRAVYFQFWEGSGDSDDFASLRLQTGGTATFADYFNAACDFDSTPAAGTVTKMLCAIVKDA